MMIYEISSPTLYSRTPLSLSEKEKAPDGNPVECNLHESGYVL
jgi:hypothetical protein